MNRLQPLRRALLKMNSSASRHFELSVGRFILSGYVFLGLVWIDYSLVRVATSILAGLLVLCRHTSGARGDENEPGCWHWSPTTSRSVAFLLMLSACAVLPTIFLRGRIETAGHRGTLLVASIIFSAIIGVALYLANFLDTPAGMKIGSRSLESLRLEHQSCLTLYQTIGTASFMLFLGALFTPIFSLNQQAGDMVPGRIGWAFYCFGGMVVWLARPCMARAKYIRFEIERILSAQAELQGSDSTKANCLGSESRSSLMNTASQGK